MLLVTLGSCPMDRPRSPPVAEVLAPKLTEGQLAHVADDRLGNVDEGPARPDPALAELAVLRMQQGLVEPAQFAETLGRKGKVARGVEARTARIAVEVRVRRLEDHLAPGGP